MPLLPSMTNCENVPFTRLYLTRNVEITARSASMKDALKSSGTRKRRSFATRVSNTAIATARMPSFTMTLTNPISNATGDSEKDEQLQRGGPFDQREVRAGILEHHRFMNHRELQMRRGVVDGQPSGFG